MRGSEDLERADEDLVLVGSREPRQILKRMLKIQSECANYFSTNRSYGLTKSGHQSVGVRSLQPLDHSLVNRTPIQSIRILAVT